MKKAEKEKMELMKLNQEVKEKAEEKEQQYGLMNDYLQTMGQVCTTGGKDLMGEHLYKTYFNSCQGEPDVEKVVQIAEEYCVQVEDMLRDAVNATDMLKDFRVELQNYAPGGADDYRMPEPGDPDYRADWDFRVGDPEEQNEKPDTRMEEIPDDRLEEKLEEKPEEKKE